MRTVRYAACPTCGTTVVNGDGDPVPPELFPAERRQACGECGEPLWTLMRPGRKQKSRRELVVEAMCQLLTIGPKTAGKLVRTFGGHLLSGMLADNVHEFINLMDADGELVFSDRRAARMERAMATLEFSFGQGGYQPTEFIKRYLQDWCFDLLVVDEGHEYKNDGSALKEQLLWVQTFDTVEELRQALLVFKDRFNLHWLLQRHRYATPAWVRAAYASAAEAA